MAWLKWLSMVFLLAWVAGVGSACAGSDAGGSTQSPEAFLHAVYARYTAHGTPLDIDDAAAATVYEPSLLALMREDRRVLQGEAGVLDADPLCACQDHDVRKVTWQLQAAGSAGWSARVSFENLGQAQHLVLALVRGPSGWRIADISGENIPSLRASLQDEIQAAAQPPATP